MKKMFTLMFMIATMCPLFAETVALDTELNIKEAIKEYKLQILNTSTGNEDEIGIRTEDFLTKKYTTVECNDYLIVGGSPNYPNREEEKSVTTGYTKVRVDIPNSYTYNDNDSYETFSVYGGNNAGIYFGQGHDKINIKIKKKGTIGGLKDISFKLDYDIHLCDRSNEKERLNSEFNDVIENECLSFTFKYSPRYFKFRSLSESEYNKYLKDIKEINIQYMDTEVTLEANVGYIFSVTSPRSLFHLKGVTSYFVLEPNFENLYADFVYVRQGYHTTKTIKE